MLQVDRMDAIAAVHDFRVRVVVATDLAARGLDLANVNLVSHSSERLLQQSCTATDLKRQREGIAIKVWTHR